jgi:putative hydrolase of the HAD superfamily
MHAIEIANLRYYGYGIKGFVMSLIESGVLLTNGRITGADVGRMLDWAKQMQTAPIELFAHAAETVAALAERYPLMLITKGDLLDQEAKLDRSGLRAHFRYVEIVSEKTQAVYAAILARHKIAPQRFLMIGNSLKSDILPVVALGGRAVHIPAHLLWEHEAAAPPNDRRSYEEVEHLGLLPQLVESWAMAATQP